MSALCCESASSRAEEASDAADGEMVTLDASPSEDANAETFSIADAHAQFESVSSPPSLSLSEPGSYGSVLTYMGLDGWQHGGSAYVGSEWSPSTESPFVFRAFGSDGVDDFRTSTMTYRSETMRASLLPGYRVRAGTFDLKLFVGGDFLLRTPLRPSGEPTVMSFGARAAADLWWEPAKDWMLSGSVSATTIERGVSARFASGRRVMSAWVGPEVLAMNGIYNTQWRAGAHVSGFQVGLTEWSIAGGYAQDSFGRSGAYARLGISYRPLW